MQFVVKICGRSEYILDCETRILDIVHVRECIRNVVPIKIHALDWEEMLGTIEICDESRSKLATSALNKKNLHRQTMRKKADEVSGLSKLNFVGCRQSCLII